MNKGCLLFLFSSLICLGVSAQTQHSYFFKNNGQQVKLRDSADWLRIVKEPEAGSELYAVNEHYLDGTVKSTGLSSRIDPLTYEGQYISYYRSGKKKMVANYKKGRFVDVYHYYPNGNLYTITDYATTPDGQRSRYIKSVKDSTGKDLVIDGTGRCGFYDSEFKQITETGNIKNGLYEGVWAGQEDKNGTTYEETYVSGKMISGESTDKEGRMYTYTKSYIEPQFKGGMEGYNAFFKKTLKYPSRCRRAEIEGIVMLTFMVMKDGSVTNIKVLKTPDPLLAIEAVRVAKAFPLWEPGIHRGRAIDVACNLPVQFLLR